MRKRLRKKRRLGEFREDAFQVTYVLHDGITPQEAEELVWSFIQNAIEANGLLCGGGSHEGSVHSEGEPRFILIGMTAAQRLVVVAHTERGDNIRIENARPATRKETRDYEQGTAE